MTDWRGDLLKIGIIPDDMPDQTNFVLFNLDELANHMTKELDKAREEGIFTQWELEYIRELAKEDRLFTRNVVEYNTDTELIKKISNLLKTKEDEK